MVLALNTNLVNDRERVLGPDTSGSVDDMELELAKARLRLLKMKQPEVPASEQKDPIFGVSMAETARAVKGENKTGVEGFVRGFAAKPFQMLGGMQDLGQMAAKDPIGTGKKIVVESAKAFNQARALSQPTGAEFGSAIATEATDLQEQGAGGWTFDKLMQIAGAAGAGQGIATAVKVARAAKTAGGITKAFRAFTSGAIKAAPEITPEAAAKVFTEATEQAVTPEMLDALKGKFNKPVAGATEGVEKSMPEATTSTPLGKKKQFAKMIDENVPESKKETLVTKFEGDEKQAMELGSFGGPGTFKQLGETITRGIEKMGGGGKPKDAPGIRLDNINVSDDIKTNVKARLDDVAKQISDKKGAPLTHEEVLDRAVEADLLKGFIDREKTAEVAASLTRTQQNLAALAEQNPVGIDPEWAKQATKVSSMATDLGRRLNALKIPVKSELYEFKMKMIKELTDRGHDLDTIVRVFDGVDFTNAKAVGKAYKTLLPKMEKVRLWIDKFRYTNMLSGPKTHIINQTGNVLQSLVMRPVDRFNWGVLDFGRSKLTGAAREAYATDFIPYYRGFVGSAKDGAKMAFDVLRGKNKIEKPDLDLTQLPLGGAYTPVEVIPRLMEAADVFTRTMMEGAEMKLGASSGAARSTANTYLFRNLPDTANKTGQGVVAAVFDRATAVAEYLRKDFTIQSGGKPVHVWNPMKLMIPFVQTPMNILKEGMIARNPLLGSVNLVGNTAKMESVAKMMTGGMILAAAGAYAYNNRVSYTAPTSQKGKQMFYGAGLKPYSIITPDGHSVSMQRLGPVAYPFVLASATKWYFDKNPKAATESNLEKTSQVLTVYAKFLTDQSYMQGIGSVLDALEGEGKLVRAATGPARQFIPLSSLQSWVNDYFLDPVYRKPSNNFDAEGIAENMYRSMIGMSKKLEPYRDSEERKEKRQNPTLNAFSPVEISKINRDKRGEYNEYLAGQRERAIEKKQAR